MLTWTSGAKRFARLQAQLVTAQAELAALRQRHDDQTARAHTADERSAAQDSTIENLTAQVHQLRNEVDNLVEALAREQHARTTVEHRLEQYELHRAEEQRTIKSALVKLEKSLEQQAADARTTAAILLARIGLVEGPSSS
ncbi:hypothetical protein [Sphingomonas sp.]|uniref:hypothetical protein n=1 Tax=Sphingomonas sp. TaxID=28214 RepID=UPI003B3A0619